MRLNNILSQLEGLLRTLEDHLTNRAGFTFKNSNKFLNSDKIDRLTHCSHFN